MGHDIAHGDGPFVAPRGQCLLTGPIEMGVNGAHGVIFMKGFHHGMRGFHVEEERGFRDGAGSCAVDTWGFHVEGEWSFMVVQNKSNAVPLRAWPC